MGILIRELVLGMDREDGFLFTLALGCQICYRVRCFECFSSTSGGNRAGQRFRELPPDKRIVGGENSSAASYANRKRRGERWLIVRAPAPYAIINTLSVRHRGALCLRKRFPLPALNIIYKFPLARPDESTITATAETLYYFVGAYPTYTYKRT